MLNPNALAPTRDFGEKLQFLEANVPAITWPQLCTTFPAANPRWSRAQRVLRPAQRELGD